MLTISPFEGRGGEGLQKLSSRSRLASETLPAVSEGPLSREAAIWIKSLSIMFLLREVIKEIVFIPLRVSLISKQFTKTCKKATKQAAKQWWIS